MWCGHFGHDRVPGAYLRTIATMSDPSSIGELLATACSPTSSFEYFPPKDDESHALLLRTIDELEEVGPDWVSVTYGANGSNRARTLAITTELGRRHRFRVMGHLTCTGQTVDELKAAIDAYGNAGITNILAIRGDMPGGASVAWEQYPGGLANATELVELIASRGPYSIGVGAFPDGHTGSSVEMDARILLGKQQAGASFAISQLFFDVEHYFAMIGRARSIGCTLPIVPGIMPVSSLKQLGRFAQMSGADIPAAMAERLMTVSDDAEQVRQVGFQIATELCTRLLTGGAPGLHFYTQNRSRATREIVARLKGFI